MIDNIYIANNVVENGLSQLEATHNRTAEGNYILWLTWDLIQKALFLQQMCDMKYQFKHE